MDDLFGDVPQPAREPPPPPRAPLTADDIREKMLAMIERARAAEAMPFVTDEERRLVAMFPIMAQWLSEEEGARLRRDFDAELERLREAA